jgi:hypothetical protein
LALARIHLLKGVLIPSGKQVLDYPHSESANGHALGWEYDISSVREVVGLASGQKETCGRRPLMISVGGGYALLAGIQTTNSHERSDNEAVYPLARTQRIVLKSAFQQVCTRPLLRRSSCLSCGAQRTFHSSVHAAWNTQVSVRYWNGCKPWLLQQVTPPVDFHCGRSPDTLSLHGDPTCKFPSAQSLSSGWVDRAADVNHLVIVDKTAAGISHHQVACSFSSSPMGWRSGRHTSAMTRGQVKSYNAPWCSVSAASDALLG